jgi:hypothetical protein
MGRPSRKGIDSLRTQVWYEAVRIGLDLKSAYEMDDYFGTGTDRNWYKYKGGTRVPTHATLAAVERVVPNSRAVFDIGPLGVSLWKAFSAPHAELWDVIDEAFPQYAEPRKQLPLGLMQYRNFLDRRFIPPEAANEIDYVEWQQGDQPNAIMLAHQRDLITIRGADIACGVAYWRLSYLVAFDMLFANYLLGGLESAFPDVFGNVIGRLLQDYACRNLGKTET